MSSSWEAPLPRAAPALVHDASARTLSIQTLPVPVPAGPDEHLIRVHAVALTNGELTWPEPSTLRHPIPGYEVSGTVVRAPAGSRFPPGAQVYARTGFDRAGSARAFSIALTAELGHKPPGLSWEEAATVPLSALTAWQALFVHGGIAVPDVGAATPPTANAAKRVLITAAAGGVGIWAVQLARLAGVGHVVGTCGPSNAEFVRGLGAHELVDYTVVKDLSSWIGEDEGGKFDFVLDCVGGASLEQDWTCVRDGGLLVSIVMPPHLRKPATGVGEDVKGLFFIVEAEGAQLERITDLITAGKCRAVLDSVYPLEEYEKAFEKLRGGHLRGKVVLRVSS